MALVKLSLEQPMSGPGAQILLLSKLRAVSRRLGFDTLQRERMELVQSEIMTNQVKHAQGKGMLQIWETMAPYPALDIFAIDYGPGIKHVANAAEDGFSTVGTMGHGLGTIRRLSNESALYSLTGKGNKIGWSGVAVWARFHTGRDACICGCDTGAYLRAYQDGPFNGDCILIKCSGNKLRWLHLDGLGHGQEAAEAAGGARDILEQSEPLERLMELASDALRGSRGAVGLVGEADPARGTVELCGVGDMLSIHIENDTGQKTSFSPGILGHAHRSLTTHKLNLGDGILITASDGLRGNWDTGSLPGLWRLHPQMVTLLLGELLGRVADDKSVFAIKLNKRGGQ